MEKKIFTFFVVLSLGVLAVLIGKYYLERPKAPEDEPITESVITDVQPSDNGSFSIGNILVGMTFGEVVEAESAAAPYSLEESGDEGESRDVLKIAGKSIYDFPCTAYYNFDGNVSTADATESNTALEKAYYIFAPLGEQYDASKNVVAAIGSLLGEAEEETNKDAGTDEIVYKWDAGETVVALYYRYSETVDDYAIFQLVWADKNYTK